MNDNDVKTISITIDEYIDLRNKAGMNTMLFEKLGFFESKLYTLENKVFELERSKNDR